jgi:hypothetical protein
MKDHMKQTQAERKETQLVRLTRSIHARKNKKYDVVYPNMTNAIRAWFSGMIKKSKTMLRLWVRGMDGIFLRISNRNNPAIKNMMKVSQRIVQ